MHLRPRLQQSYNSNNEQIQQYKQQNQKTVGFPRELIQSQRNQNQYLEQNNNYINVRNDDNRNGGRNNSYQKRGETSGLNQIIYPDNNTSSWSVNQMNQISSGQNTGQFGNGSMLNSNGRGSNNSYIMNHQNDNISNKQELIPRSLQNNYNTINYDESIQNLQNHAIYEQNQKLNWQTLQNKNLKPVSAQLQQFMNVKKQSQQRPLTSKDIQKQRSQDQGRMLSKESQDTNKGKFKAKTGRFISNNPKKLEENNFPKQQSVYNNQRPIIPKYLGSTLNKNQEGYKLPNKIKNENTSLHKIKQEQNNNNQGIPIQIFNQNVAQKYQGDNAYDLPRQMNVRNISNDKNHFKNKEAIVPEQNLQFQTLLNKNYLNSNEKQNELQKQTQKYYLDLYYKEKFNKNIKNEEIQNSNQIDLLKQKLNFDKEMDDQQFFKFIDYYKQFQNNNNYPLLSQLIQNQEKEQGIQIDVKNQNKVEQIKEEEGNKDYQVNKSSSSEDSDRGMQQMLNQIKQEVLQLKIQKGLIPDSSNVYTQINNQNDPQLIQMQSPVQSQNNSNHLQHIPNFNQIPPQYSNFKDIGSLSKILNLYQVAQENKNQNNEGNNNNTQIQLEDQKLNEFSPENNLSIEKYHQNKINPQQKSIQENIEQENINITEQIKNKLEQIENNKNKQEQKTEIEKKNEGMNNRQKIKNINEEQKILATEEEKYDKRRIQTSPITRQQSQKDENKVSQIQGVFLQKNKSNNTFSKQNKDIDQEEKDFLYLNIPASNKSDVEEISERNEPSNQNQQRIFQNSPLSSKKQLDGQSQSNSSQQKSKSNSDDLNIIPRQQNNFQIQNSDLFPQNNTEETKIELNSRRRSNSNTEAINQLNNQDQYTDKELNSDFNIFDQQQFVYQGQINIKEPIKSFKQKMIPKDKLINKNQQIKENNEIISQQNNIQIGNIPLNIEEQKIRERMGDNIIKQSQFEYKYQNQINENEREMRNSISGISISKSQKTCNNSSQKFSNDISELMIEQKLSSVKKLNLKSNQKSIRLDDIILNEQSSIQNNGNQHLNFNNEIFLNMLEQKLQNQWNKQQKSITHDQNLQTDPVILQQVKQQFSKEIQTNNSNSNKMQLSPFETYDLLFIKDLVNNLNKDNEILFDNTSDLKTAFLFLHQEHKNLQFKYQKEKRNSCFVDIQKERIQEVMNERDKALQIGMKLRDKIEIMTDIMKIAVEQQNQQNGEQDQIIEQLQEENKQLRELLQIHRSIQSENTYIQQGKNEQKQQDEWMESSQEIDKNDSVEIEIDNGLIQYEQEIRRNQDDYLIFLKAEQDRQFNQEIDEHKEILSQIYDQKLIQKTQEIEQSLLDTLTQQITESLSSNIQKEMTNHIRNQLREEVKQEVRSQIIEEVTQELKNKFQTEFKHEAQLQIEANKHVNQKEEIKDDISRSDNQINENEINKDDEKEYNEQIIMDQINEIVESNISNESEPFKYQNNLLTDQQIIQDKYKIQKMDDKNILDFKFMLDDQPMTQEEQELLQQLFQREEGIKEQNQGEEEHKINNDIQSHQIDNDETQKIIFQEINQQDTRQQWNHIETNQQERRNHNQSQGFQGQHVFNNYFTTNLNVVDQVSNELFQGQSRGSQRLDSIFYNDSNNYTQAPLHTNNQANDYNISFKSVQGFQGQSSAQFHNQDDQIQQQIQNNQNLQQNNEMNFEELNSQFNDDYSDFLQGLEQTNLQRYTFQQTQNDEPFELANQIEDNFNDQLNDDQHEYNYQQLSRCGESIDFLGDQLEKDLFNSQDNIQTPISFLMDDGELISDIFKLKQPNNSISNQQSPMKRDYESNILDSTKGIRSMLVQMQKINNEQIGKDVEENNEREEYKEEEYDYFLDAQQDENLMNNDGYHIIDQAELDQSESKDKETKSQTEKPNSGNNNEYDEDIENIEDEELREYRYRNMLEELKESIQSEDEEANRKNHF